MCKFESSRVATLRTPFTYIYLSPYTLIISTIEVVSPKFLISNCRNCYYDLPTGLPLVSFPGSFSGGTFGSFSFSSDAFQLPGRVTYWGQRLGFFCPFSFCHAPFLGPFFQHLSFRHFLGPPALGFSFFFPGGRKVPRSSLGGFLADSRLHLRGAKKRAADGI